MPKSDPLVDLDPLRVYPKADPARPSPPPPYQGPTDTLKAKHAMLANTYGIAMPAKMDIECQILSKCVPQPSGPWPRSRPPRPANDQKVCAVFPPAPSPRPLIPVSDLRPFASSLSLVTGRGDFSAFPRPGSASRS